MRWQYDWQSRASEQRQHTRRRHARRRQRCVISPFCLLAFVVVRVRKCVRVCVSSWMQAVLCSDICCVSVYGSVCQKLGIPTMLPSRTRRHDISYYIVIIWRFVRNVLQCYSSATQMITWPRQPSMTVLDPMQTMPSVRPCVCHCLSLVVVLLFVVVVFVGLRCMSVCAACLFALKVRD